MSVRQRTTFKFVENEREEDLVQVLDEQEQEELLNEVKEESQTRNRQYELLLIGVLGLSAVLQMLYLTSPTRESPFAVIFPSTTNTVHRPIPGSTLFTLLTLLLHANLLLHLLQPTHPVRSAISTTLADSPPVLRSYVPLPFFYIFSLSSIGPVLALVVGQGWLSVLWWSTGAGVTWLIWSAKRWMSEEAAEIQKLEGLKYNAKGA